MRFSLFAFSLLAVVSSFGLGCSAAPEEDASSQTADLVGPFWTQAEAASSVVVSTKGSGNIAFGDACAIGSASYVINTTAPPAHGARTVYVNECFGAPARERSRVVQLTDVEYTAVVGAARSVAFSDKETCDAGARYAVIGVVPREVGAFPSQNATTEAYGCDYGQAVSGLDRVLDLLEPIVAAAPAPTPSIFLGGEVEPGEKIWKAGARVYLKAGGGGETPPGSLCVRDAVDYSLTIGEDGELDKVYATKCVDAGGTAAGRLGMRQQVFRALAPVEKTRLADALSRMTASSSARCLAGAEFVRLYVTAKGDDGIERTVAYTGTDNACVMGSDNAPYANVGALRTYLDQIIAAP